MSKSRRRSEQGPVLPIAEFKKELIDAVKTVPILVVIGETGSGKTTQLPQYLYEAGLATDDRAIAVTQPRRVAAISVAHRVADEMESDVGDVVGYQVRFDTCTSEKTKIKYMTDGCLLREFLTDDHLDKYDVVVLDEAHERSLDTVTKEFDILFGLVKKLVGKSKADGRRCPKIVVMSATLDPKKFSTFFDECPVFEIPGRLFPVDNIFCDLITESDAKNPNYVSKVVEVVMDIHVEYPPGDVLVFLTGQAEIETACDILFDRAERVDYEYDVQHSDVEAVLILPIYGAMPTDQQRAVFEPAGKGIRKIIVATNIAGTSLTIDGIRYVVDSGFVKQLIFNPRTGLDALTVVSISKSEATQRSGRAGRTAPGKCFRIYTRDFHDKCMTKDMVPEIQRTNLTSVVLSLKCLGVRDVLNFDYVDPPEERMLLEALKQLYIFEAIDKRGEVTALGRQMAELPLSPGLARALIRSVQLKCDRAMLPISAMLSVENVLVRAVKQRDIQRASESHQWLADRAGGSNDFATLLCIYQKCHESDKPSAWCSSHFVHWRAMKMARKVHDQLASLLGKIRVPRSRGGDEKSNATLSDRVRQSICAGFFTNTARKAPTGKGFRAMDGHGTLLHVHPSSALFGLEESLDWIVYHEVVWTTRVYARTVCPVRYEWIKDLLPRLHIVDVHMLSSSGAVDGDVVDRPSTLADVDGDGDDKVDEGVTASKLAKRNTDASVAAAKERYLQRKQGTVRK